MNTDEEVGISISNRRHWHVLVAVCMIMWGVYFVYDVPSSLSVALKEHLSLPAPQYTYLVSALYTAYAAPNMILPFFSGFLVQRIGEKLALLTNLLAVLVGQLIFSVSLQLRSQLGMILGRVFIGLGGEIIGVLGTEITTRWFKNKQLSLALAITLSVSRLGSVAKSAIIPVLIEDFGIVRAVWIGSMLSLGIAVVGAIYLLGVRGGTLVHHESENAGTMSPIRQFPSVFWKLAWICVLGYGGINTFPISAQRFLAAWFYDGDQRKAGAVTGIPYFLSGALVPVFGLFFNENSFQSYPPSLCATNILMGVAHLLLLVTTKPTLPLTMLGIAYALYGVAFWAALAQCLLSTVESISAKENMSHSWERSIYESEYGSIQPPEPPGGFPDDPEEHEPRGTSAESLITLGYGIMTSLNNLSSAVIPILLAKVENVMGFTGLEVVFLILSLLGLLASLELLLSVRVSHH
ncbi:unnamed protein product [Penicillium salamii]|uniref:Lysosomal dipeptide transporter MFSD1 n=1 Tax=Penicillium salamii TaxID=1612424 RepID=A0A9W4JBD3_9EURO|nr:unnamed protein product [Penicillium salamii]